METAKAESLTELRETAKAILEKACVQNAGACVIGLSGDLGAGKTAFVKALGDLLGVKDEITSPTFVIMKSYDIKTHPFLRTLTHIDAYRIESEDEMRVLGFSELLKDSERLVCIEWPEKIEHVLPKDMYPVTLAIEEGETRSITYGN